MKLTKEILNNAEISQHFALPTYDIEAVAAHTLATPTWLQLGAGNIFRGFLGSCQQHLLNEGLAETGIIVAEGYDYEIVDVLKQYDQLTINVTLKETGEVEQEVLGSLSAYLKMDTEAADFAKLQTILASPSLQMISLTITEKGYSLVDNQGNIQGAIQHDFDNGPAKPISYLGKLVSLLWTRFNAGAFPIALVSMDNMSHNGEKLRQAVLRFVEEWHANQFVDQAFVDYLSNGENVSFPWSMIDKITPRPDQKVQRMLEETGLTDMHPQETAKHTFVAPYVNGEETQYLIIEDDFPNGRPHLEQAGIIFTTRETVNAVETMKVTTCLNPLHTALAIYGCLLNIPSIHEAMNHAHLVALIKRLGYQEGLPVVTDPKILNPKTFIDQVIEVRLPNPFIPDTPQRIATDTSQKLSVRYGETIKAYVAQQRDLNLLEAIPFVFAGWLRYLTGVNDSGEAFAISPDPLASKVQPIVADFTFGQQIISDEFIALLKDQNIFGVDLYEVGLADKVIAYYQELSQQPGAVAQALTKF